MFSILSDIITNLKNIYKKIFSNYKKKLNLNLNTHCNL